MPRNIFSLDCMRLLVRLARPHTKHCSAGWISTISDIDIRHEHSLATSGGLARISLLKPYHPHHLPTLCLVEVPCGEQGSHHFRPLPNGQGLLGASKLFVPSLKIYYLTFEQHTYHHARRNISTRRMPRQCPICQRKPPFYPTV